MKEDLLRKICEMLRSNDEELRNLGVDIFCQNTNDYRDYKLLRHMFSNNMWLERPEERVLFNRIFNHIDKDTIDCSRVYQKTIHTYRMTSPSSKQKKKQWKNNNKRLII